MCNWKIPNILLYTISQPKMTQIRWRPRHQHTNGAFTSYTLTPFCINNWNCADNLAPTSPALYRQNQLAPYVTLLCLPNLCKAQCTLTLWTLTLWTLPLLPLNTNTVYLSYYVHLMLYWCYILLITVNCVVWTVLVHHYYSPQRKH